MFTIYEKTVGGRRTQRYFMRWANAEKALNKDREEVEKYGWMVQKSVKKFVSDKGFYIFHVEGVTDGGETFSLDLTECYFED